MTKLPSPADTAPDMPDTTLTGHTVSLHLVGLQDAAYLCALRNDPRYSSHLSASVVTVAAQRDWIAAYKTREAQGLEYYFVIRRRDDGRACGAVRIYGVTPPQEGGGQFTWGSWILDAAKPARAALDSALLVYRFGFDVLGLARAVFDVRCENAHTLRFHDRFGAPRVGQDAQDVFYEIPAALGGDLARRAATAFA
ncbi:MAG: GNAT family N-acetyltransferase [Paracoccaceae bacterium]|nr:GNAT family N-acetyltransferase [Paracoccaceae bacterium]